MYGIGVIGTGWCAGAHIANFKTLENVEVRGVLSSDAQRAQSVIDDNELAVARAFDSLDEFLANPEINVVLIASRHTEHCEQIIACAKAGKHIIAEKPLCLNKEDLERIAEAVDLADIYSSVCFELRWMDSIANAKKMLNENLIGKPFYGECSYFHGIGPWYKQWAWNIKKETGGGSLLTAGCHALDCLMYLMGSKVEEVSAYSSTSEENPLEYEYDPNIVGIMKFENGAIGKVASSVECRQPYHFPVIIQGAKGTLRDNQFYSTDFGQKDWATIPAAMPDSGDVYDHSYIGQIKYFFECMERGEKTHNSIENCLHVHDVIFAMDQAAETGQSVKVKKR